MSEDGEKSRAKKRPQQKQWGEMGQAEKRAWCAYLKGNGPKPGPSEVIRWSD